MDAARVVNENTREEAVSGWEQSAETDRVTEISKLWRVWSFVGSEANYFYLLLEQLFLAHSVSGLTPRDK